MREINKIIIHCTKTREGQDISVDTVRKWHVEDNGWSDIGYHFFIDIKGNLHDGRDITRKGAHTLGENDDSIGIAYAGGVSDDLAWKDTRNKEQKETLLFLLTYLKTLFPKVEIYGHRDFSANECPSFDAREEYKHI